MSRKRWEFWRMKQFQTSIDMTGGMITNLVLVINLGDKSAWFLTSINGRNLILYWLDSHSKITDVNEFCYWNILIERISKIDESTRPWKPYPRQRKKEWMRLSFQYLLEPRNIAGGKKLDELKKSSLACNLQLTPHTTEIALALRYLYSIFPLEAL